ncbi:mucin-5AC-like [Gadus chalcogrammus]|uniref:mucin-5AC-like n=1 Tax=Gadus chalcogrammus TaxID=1042646 RepID=UPI0024C4D0D7|nr:mucin-5AC-like [Gadus chalcogrammus]
MFLLRNANPNDSTNNNYGNSRTLSSYCVFHGRGYNIKAFHCRCDAIFLEAYGSIFITTLVLGFSPSIDGNTTIEVELVFNNTASPEVTISTADVLETMTTAATNTSAGGFSFDPESIVVTETPTSTTAPTTTTATPEPSVPTVSFTVEATISKPFTAELTDQTTAEFQELQTTVVTSCDAIFLEAYGSIFITTLVLGFSPSIDGNTTIEVELVFNNTASPEVTVSTADVLETMTTAATNTSAGGISFDPESIVVTETPTSTTTTSSPTSASTNGSLNTTAAPSSNTFSCASDPPLCCLGQDNSCNRVCFCDVACLRIGDCCSDFNATCITGFPTSQPSNFTNTTSTNETTFPILSFSGNCSANSSMCCSGENPSCFNGCFCDESCASRPIPDCCPDYSDTCMIETPTPTTAPTVSFTVEATLSKPFTAELTNQTTAEFQELQTTVVTSCDAIFQEAYGSVFITTLVLGFSPSIDGNTTIEVELVFNNTASPEVTVSTADVLETMTTAATNTSAGGFSFDPESIVVTVTSDMFLLRNANLNDSTNNNYGNSRTLSSYCCDAIFLEAYGSIFITTLVLGFR